MTVKLSVRTRLLLFGSIWLTVCSIILTYYLVKHSKISLLNNAEIRSQLIADKFAEQAHTFLYSGNQDEVYELIRHIKVQPYILDVSFIYKDVVISGERFEFYDQKKEFKSNIGSSRLFTIDGIHAIESLSTVQLDGENPNPVTTSDGTGLSNPIGKAIVFISVEPIFLQIDHLIHRIVMIVSGLLIGGLLIGWVLSGKMVRPLDRLSSYIVFNNRFRANQNTTHPAYKRQSEIDLIYVGFRDLEKTLEDKTKDLQKAQIKYKEELETATNEFEKKNYELAEQIETHNKMLLLLSHEVRTPIAALSLHISNLFNSFDQNVSKTQAAKIEKIKSLTQRIFSLIDSVLRFSLKENDLSNINRKNIALRPTVERVVFSLEGFSKQLNVRCVLDSSLNDKGVFVNADHLEQILINLVHNAIKQSPPGSTIFLSADDSEDEFIQFYVTDSGLGIDNSLKELIFKNPIRLEGRKSNGVGLFICHYLVELNKGSIWFKDNEPQGTIFVLKFRKYELINEKV